VTQMSTLLTQDFERFDSDQVFTTRDGLTVSITSESDIYGVAAYGGSYLSELESLCPGLVGDIDELGLELPIRECRIPDTVRGLYQSLTPGRLRALLRGDEPSRLPRAVLARMYATVEYRSNAAAQYDDWTTMGMDIVRITVSRRGRLICSRELAGICPRRSRTLIRQATSSTLADARRTLRERAT